MDLPSTVQITSPNFVPERFTRHIVRRLSDLKGQFHDEDAYLRLLVERDVVVYEVYEFARPEVLGELSSGISIVHSGLVGDEFFMTKGHFHEILDTAEVYYGLGGRALWSWKRPKESLPCKTLCLVRCCMCLRDGHTDQSTPAEGVDLVTLFVYPANAGHDYRSIETQGFRKIVVNQNGGRAIIDRDS